MSSLKALTSVMLRLNVEGLVMNDVTQLILMYFIIPLWFTAGIVDWFCHRSSNIAATAGPKESLIHLLMFLLLIQSPINQLQLLMTIFMKKVIS